MSKTMLFVVVSVCILVFGVSAYLYAAEPVTVKGEIIDTYCYNHVGARGEGHRQCAIDCIKAGAPAGLLEDGTNKVYVLLPNKDKSPLLPAVLDNVARKVSVTGKMYESGGSRFLTVESIKP